MTLVEIDGARVRFPRRADPALTVEELRVERGHDVVVLGPTGSGKSTLLHAIAGHVPHSVNATLEGDVAVCGLRTAEHSVVRLSRHVGLVAQDPSAGTTLPYVEQEVALPLENRAVDPVAISGRVDRALDRVGARGLRSRRQSELSGGELQRVATAAALVAEPDLLLLDEPTSMLDADGVASVRDVLASGVGAGPTTVLVEHRLDELAGASGAGLPPRAVVLDRTGRLVAAGPTADVLAVHARDLHAAGCWLPLDTELRAATGAPGGLTHRDNRAHLLTAGRRTGPRTPPRGEVVLGARGLAVGRAGAVLADVDLDLRAGEVVAVLGANGSGKSTLLLTLAGLLPPYAGTVTGPRAGLVFQNPEHQFCASTVAAETAHGLGAGGEAAGARELRRFGLDDLVTQNPYRLSGGEKRRLSLAAVLAHERPALVLDEPTLGLDRADTVTTAAAMRREAEGGRAVLFASHDLRTVAGAADRVLVLGDGRVLACAPTWEVLRDRGTLAGARLALPPLLAWLTEHLDDDGCRAALRSLDGAAR
ncbi:cobalt ABC transporter ATP-binding protein [Nocardioides flavus (ex Wang et al. 2016)]|uniref:Cobalt ABC transporter ATP-binding protein n=1 Tax=Nocardioides flavus (ex Wang et al. 2016) TaxID=2058780 RepID=A0ABQ3HJ28_9ACTN|nr:ABC transporter ATP-binding protein [Nocardioides flavus (ex Wang et al. 2016)]GHE16726.1 cobalt ABC transporter ATP-binding protein [Nocardioides flavus (ex Wang et al. 2016)]